MKILDESSTKNEFGFYECLFDSWDSSLFVIHEEIVDIFRELDQHRRRVRVYRRNHRLYVQDEDLGIEQTFWKYIEEFGIPMGKQVGPVYAPLSVVRELVAADTTGKSPRKLWEAKYPHYIPFPYDWKAI